MYKKSPFALLFFSLLMAIAQLLSAAQPPEKPSTVFDDTTGMIIIDYAKEPIANILYFLQTIKKINIVPPFGSAAMKETVTFKSEQQFSIDDFYAWVVSLLDQMGYIVTKRPNILIIGQKTAENLREPVDLFINTPIAQIPDSDQIIRYVYYLENSKISLSTDGEFNVLVKEFLSPTGIFRVDINANAYVIADRASNIKTVVNFLQELDQPTQQETIDFIHLIHAEAPMIAGLLQELLNTKVPGTENDPQLPKGILDTRKQSDLLYFAKGTKVFPIAHNNSIMLVGRQQAIDQIKEFIKEKVDTEIDHGNSVLHTYQLQYTDAASMAPTLQRVVDSTRAGGTGQSEGSTGTTNVKGNERLFNEIIIQADRPANAEERQYYGGNNLIFGCTSDDYQQIKQLVVELDTAPSLILLEIAIADLSSEDNRLLGTITRNPEKLALLSSMQYQSSHLPPGIVVDNFDNPTTIAADLLQNSIDSSGKFVSPASATNSIAKGAEAGSTVVSFNDASGKTWSMLQILKLFSHSKIVQHPHIIAVDNKPSLVKIGESRLLPDETTNSASGVAVQQNKQVEANLKIEIVPRKSNDDTVTLQIDISIDDFKNREGNKTTRATKTTVNVKSGSIFAISGLSQTNRSEGISKVPVIADVPVVGWLFGKRQNGDTTQSNLSIFISATIIEPRLREGIGDHTKSYIEMARDFGRDTGIFNSAKDPITRWFFTNQSTQDLDESLNAFVQKHTKNTARPVEFLSLTSLPMPGMSQTVSQKESNGSKKQYVDNQQKLESLMNDLQENPFTRNTHLTV
jgi:general secretion pathway protein D